MEKEEVDKKKILKWVIVIIAGGVLLLGGILYFLLPEAISYYTVKNICTQINDKLMDYPYYDQQIPDDYVSDEFMGVNFQYPSTFEANDLVLPKTISYCDKDIDAEEQNEGLTIYIQNDSDMIPEEWKPGNVNVSLSMYFKRIGGRTPENFYEFRRLAYDLDMSDIGFLPNQAAAFTGLAIMKEVYCGSVSMSYFYENETYNGFIHIYESTDYGSETNKWYCELWRKDDNNDESINIIITSSDLGMIKSILASFK